MTRDAGGLDRSGVWILLGTLGALILVNAPQLGSDAWEFRPGRVEPRGILGPLVRAADRHWDYGFVRTPGVVAFLGLCVLALLVPYLPRWRTRTALGLATLVAAALILPALLLQVGLREATAPWFYTNDSTYQIELAGDLVLDGDNPYGHDYSRSGLERFYSLDGSVAPETEDRQVALRHFAYFPGTVVTAAAWRLFPGPLDDYRFFVALCTLGLLFAPLLFPGGGPAWARVAAGAALAANPLSVRAVWYGTADAPSLLALVVAFALALRSRWVGAAAMLAVAVLLKQFALVALPFLALLALRRIPRRRAAQAGGTFAGVVLAGVLPFLIADPGALWSDTIRYGASTYRIVGYGLSHLLLQGGVIDDRFGYYPFVPLALAIWLPLTAWLLVRQGRAPLSHLRGVSEESQRNLRGRSLETDAFAAALGFTTSIFVLLFIGRVFQTSYLVWPLAGLTLTALVALAERASASSSASASAPP